MKPSFPLPRLGLVLASVAAVGAADLAARPLLHPLFSDHMVLPRNRPVPVWGWAKPGTHLRIALGRASVAAVADASGRWQAVLGPLAAGGPYDLIVEDPERVVRSDIQVGEVWLCAGQSNMEFPLAGATGGADEAATAGPATGVRVFALGQRIAGSPRLLPAPGEAPQWRVPDPASVAGCSAVAWFAGRRLAEQLHVTVGVVTCAWPGSNIRGWMSEGALDALGMFGEERSALHALAAIEAAGGPDVPAQERALIADPELRRFQGPNGGSTMLWNGGIAPLVPFAFSGVIWYQGEQDAGNPEYDRLLPALVADWRGAFADARLPVVLVGLPGFHEPVAEPVQERVTFALARDAQLAVARSVPGVGLAVTTDLGESGNVHPPRKREVGERVAAAALALVTRSGGGGGPLFDGATPASGAMIVRFTRVSGGGLALQGDGPSGFAMRSGDGPWQAAVARVEGSTVVVTSAAMKSPTAVRYGWADHPPVTLYDRAGMPAAPFRSDPR